MSLKENGQLVRIFLLSVNSSMRSPSIKFYVSPSNTQTENRTGTTYVSGAELSNFCSVGMQLSQWMWNIINIFCMNEWWELVLSCWFCRCLYADDRSVKLQFIGLLHLFTSLFTYLHLSASFLHDAEQYITCQIQDYKKCLHFTDYVRGHC